VSDAQVWFVDFGAFADYLDVFEVLVLLLLDWHLLDWFHSMKLCKTLCHCPDPFLLACPNNVLEIFFCHC
jgi:hypothetical protein